MNTKLTVGVVVGLILGFLIGALVYTGSVPGYGRASGFAHYQVESFLQGLAAGQRDQLVIANDGDITTTAEVVVNQSSFCVDLYATSSATRVRMVASTTATIEGVDGVFVYQYGECP